MPEFIFMLTRDDRTVPDALGVYEEIRGHGLQFVGFKDVGAPMDVLRSLASRIKEDGAIPVLEVVSISALDEERSVRAGVDIGIEMLMGGTHPQIALPLLAGTGIRYFPFPGTVVGHPSILRGDIAEIAEHAKCLSGTPGIDGLDLLAYRHEGDVEELIASVVRSATVPVVVAGSIDRPSRVAAVARAGAWAFTVGGAVFERAFRPGESIPAQIDEILRLAQQEYQ